MAYPPLSPRSPDSIDRPPSSIPSLPLETDAFILLKRPPADAFQSFSAFASGHGALWLQQRVPRKPSPRYVALDLFDEVSLRLESANQGRTWFVQEARLIVRHPGIGRSYESLRFASAFASLVARNPVAEESQPAVANLLRSSLAAFAAGDRPDIVYFKSLYRFARDEGYPMKEHWIPALPLEERADAISLLNRPLLAQAAAPATVARLERRLEDYLRGHTELLLE